MRYLLFILFFPFFNLRAQFTPCTATSLGTLTASTCTQTSYTVASNTTWSVNGAGGVSATGGLTVPTCRGTTDPVSTNYWFTFTVPNNSTYDVVTNLSSGGGGAVDVPEYQIFQATGGSCGSNNLTFSLVGCGGNGVQSFNPTPGATYYLRVYDDDPAGGGGDVSMSGESFSFCASLRPKNDLCANASSITPGTSVNYSTAGSGYEGTGSFVGGGACSPSVGNVWYTFTTGATPGCYSFALTNATGDNCNSVWVYSGGCPGSGGTFQNANQSTNIYNEQSSQEFTGSVMQANTTYFISVGNSTTGTFTLNVNPNVSNAANDQCASPTPINPTGQLADNAVSGCEYTYVAGQDANIAPANVCAGSLENVSWFTFQAASTGTVTISFTNITCNNGGGGFQTGLFTGSSCASLTPGTSGTNICIAAASGTATYSITTATAGTTYYIAMDGNAGSNCHFTVSGTNITTLPIELLYFRTEEIANNRAEITWSTAAEPGNDYFTIQKSIDGITFSDWMIVDSKGNYANSYSVIDENPVLDQTSYYRLKQTDVSGEFSYSSISALTFKSAKKLTFELFPNPSSQQTETTMQLEGVPNLPVLLEIQNLQGSILSSKQIELNQSGKATLNFKHNLFNGIYLIKISQGNKQLVRKFVIN